MENGYVRIFKKRKFCTEFSMEIPFAGRKKARTLPKPSMNYILRPAVYLGFYLKNENENEKWKWKMFIFKHTGVFT